MDGQPLEASRDIVLGKVDALEIRPSQGYFNSLRFLDWYRYLNCGYRLPCVGGTDKTGAWTPALLGIDAPFQRTITSSAKCLPQGKCRSIVPHPLTLPGSGMAVCNTSFRPLPFGG